MARNDFLMTFNAEGSINAYSLVKFGANDYGVLQAGAATDKIVGVTTEIAASTGDRCDVVMDGTAYVKLGGTVTRGDRLTSDGSGNAVTAAPAAGVNNNVIGTALQSGVSGDVIEVAIIPWQIQG